MVFSLCLLGISLFSEFPFLNKVKITELAAEIDRLKGEKIEITELFCSVMKVVESEQRPLLNKFSDESRAWWKEHKKLDKEKELKEQKEKEDQAKILAALNKLTDEEKKLLGL